MLEYVFFDRQPKDLFISNLQALGVAAEEQQKGDELLVLVCEDLPSDLSDKIEQCYEATYQMSEDLMAEAEGIKHFDMAGIEVHTKAGPIFASIDSKLLDKALSVFDYDELAQFVDTIASAVENPDHRPVCQRSHESPPSH